MRCRQYIMNQHEEVTEVKHDWGSTSDCIPSLQIILYRSATGGTVGLPRSLQLHRTFLSHHPWHFLWTQCVISDFHYIYPNQCKWLNDILATLWSPSNWLSLTTHVNEQVMYVTCDVGSFSSLSKCEWLRLCSCMFLELFPTAAKKDQSQQETDVLSQNQSEASRFSLALTDL